MSSMEWLRPVALLGSLVYALLGVVIFWVSFVIVDS